ncbi:MAG: class I SAM-dependent methyltransferase [Caldilineaceae bacterium]|nr:class I SAM-dependent methyltransferase [Caldilineaceae bacterium]
MPAETITTTLPSIVTLDHCPLCSNSNFSVLFDAKDIMFDLPGTFSIVKCDTCGFMFTNPRPTSTDLGMYYPAEYGPYHKKIEQKNKKRTQALRKQGLRRFFNKYLSTFKNYGYWVPELPRDSIVLDLGCSNGDFLAGLASRGWQLHGVELAEEPANYARMVHGLEVVHGTIEDATFPDCYFDAVFAFMLVEHLEDPVSTLHEVNRVLVDEGYLVFSIPNASSWQFNVFRSNWRPLEIPRHMSHFTPKSVSSLLQTTGFSLEQIIFQRSISDVFITIGYWMRNRKIMPKFSEILIDFPKRRGRITRAILLPIEWLEAILGHSSRMTVIARKRYQPDDTKCSQQ